MKRIFLVDDSGTILMSMSGILQGAGFEVETAGDGEEALKKLNAGAKPDLIITDLNMPKMNGMELIAEVKSQSGFRFTPVLVLTTESQQDKRDEAKRLGATGWLVKPVDAEQLLQVVRQVVPGA